METGLNHIRQTIVPNLERPGGAGGGKLKLSEAERKVFLDARNDMVNYPLYFGASAFGVNFAITYPLRNNLRLRWIRVPLNLLAGGFGMSYGFNRALEKLLVNLYSLPDSKIAQEGRELLQRKDPNHPLVKMINAKLGEKTSASSQILGTPSTGSVWKEEEIFPDAQASAQTLVSLEGAAKESRPKTSTTVQSSYGQSANDSIDKQFRGEDALSFSGWDATVIPPPSPQAMKPEAEQQKPTLANQKSSGRSWDEVRAEYQRRKSQS